MAATAMLNLYSSWDQFDRNDHITFDEDQSVSAMWPLFCVANTGARQCALSSYRQLPAIGTASGDQAKEVASEQLLKQKSYAVEVCNATFTYGSGSKTVSAMKDISLKVPTGEM